MKKLIILFIMMFALTSCENHKTDILPKEEVVEEDSLFQDYMNLGQILKLENRIKLDAATFAAACMIVHYCESNLVTNITGKGINNDANQTGIFQITEKTRKLLKIPELKKLSRKEQIYYYGVYLRACPKKALLSIKTSIDLHILHFAPFRYNRKILSKVSNHYLKALDKNKDNIITENDLILFEKSRIKNSKQISHIYDQFFNMTI